MASGLVARAFDITATTVRQMRARIGILGTWTAFPFKKEKIHQPVKLETNRHSISTNCHSITRQ